jgi:hypothetical protein
MTQHELEDLEKFEALKYGKENDLWIEDFYAKKITLELIQKYWNGHQ